MVIGAALFLVGLYYNPFVGNRSVSPLAVSDLDLVDLSYSLVAGDSIVFTNNGQSIVKPHPAKVMKLIEPTVSNTRVFVTLLASGGGETVGLGIKFSSDAEETALIDGEALVHSVWHIYLPERGTFLVDQTENFWPYLRDIVIPAKLSSGDNWRGSWHGVMSTGPNALGTARVTANTGPFADTEIEAVESLSARGYSAIEGPLGMSGNLTIALPHKQE
jgi:hypothetical protein